MAMWKGKDKRGATRKYEGPTRREKDQVAEPKPEAKEKNRPVKPSTRRTVTASQRGMALRLAMQRIRKNPLASLLIVLVIGTALSLPTGLQVLIKNLQLVENSFESTTQISLYLRSAVTENEALALAARIKARADIKQVQYISPQQALDEFQIASGFGDVLSQLKKNPLPPLLIVTPTNEKLNIDQFDELVLAFSGLPEVETAQSDTAWLQRLFAIADLFKKLTILITIFLVFAVLVVVGNTIRLQSQSYRDEIEVSKLVGATDGFVRAPFLYTGIFYGIAGAMMAVSVAFVTLFWLDQNVAQIASLYQNDFSLHGLDFVDVAMVITLGGVLGLGGSWIAVNRFLHQINL